MDLENLFALAEKFEAGSISKLPNRLRQQLSAISYQLHNQGIRQDVVRDIIRLNDNEKAQSQPHGFGILAAELGYCQNDTVCCAKRQHPRDNLRRSPRALSARADALTSFTRLA